MKKNKIFCYVTFSLSFLLPLISYANGYFHVINIPTSSVNSNIEVSSDAPTNSCHAVTCPSTFGSTAGGFHPYDNTPTNCQIPPDPNPSDTTNVFVVTTTEGGAGGCVVLTSQAVVGSCTIFYTYSTGGTLGINSWSCSGNVILNKPPYHEGDKNTTVLEVTYN